MQRRDASENRIVVITIIINGNKSRSNALTLYLRSIE